MGEARATGRARVRRAYNFGWRVREHAAKTAPCLRPDPCSVWVVHGPSGVRIPASQFLWHVSWLNPPDTTAWRPTRLPSRDTDYVPNGVCAQADSCPAPGEPHSALQEVLF